MSELRNRSGAARSALAVSVSLCVFAVSASALAETSEIDSFQIAVTSQTKQDTLAFIEAFPSSHLIGDLFDLLQPGIAQQVCTELAGSAPARAQSACTTLRQAYAVAPIEPAAGPTPVDAQLTDAYAPPTTSASISTFPADDPVSIPIIVRRGGRGDDNAYWPTPAAPATGAPNDSSGSSAGSSEGSLSNAGGSGASGSPSDSTSGDTASSGTGGSGGSGSSPSQSGGLVGNAGNAIGGAVEGAVGTVGGAVGGLLGGG